MIKILNFLIDRLFTIINYSMYYGRMIGTYLSTLKISDNLMIFFFFVNSERLNLIILIMKVID